MELLNHLAEKYIWWKSPTDTLQTPNQLIAQVMNIGDYADVLAMIDAVGEPALKQALQSAQAGQFNARSWTYWHYRLDLAKAGQVPSLPARRFA